VLAHLVDIEELYASGPRIVREERPALAKYVPSAKLLGGRLRTVERMVRFRIAATWIGGVRERGADVRTLRTGCMKSWVR